MNRWRDWYEQGRRDLEKARLDAEQRYFEWACFTAQQATEKVIKALGLKRGISLWGHSLNEMLGLLADTLDIPDEVREKARLLDLYYIPPRYPNGFAAGKPADYFTERQAKEALDAAGEVIRFCESLLLG